MDGKSVCNDRSAQNWPPLLATADSNAEGDYSIIMRDDASRQWAYKGQPLYLYKRDMKQGDMVGDDVQNVWHVIKQWGALGPVALGGSPVMVHLYVDNADVIYEQAIAAGAIPVMPIDDTFWGDRYGVLKDPFGHNWSIATHMRDVSEEDIREAVKGFA